MPYKDKEKLTPRSYLHADLVMIIGWQFLLQDIDDRFVVFHDSLLPKLRGFAPTVSALIAGHRQIGVTAFKPLVGADSGPIFGQVALKIDYPITIRETYESLADCYVQLANDILDRWAQDTLLPVLQS